MAQAACPTDGMLSQDTPLQKHSVIPGTAVHKTPELYPLAPSPIHVRSQRENIPQ